MASQYEIKRSRRTGPAAERRILNLRELGIPQVPLIGRYEYHSAQPGLQPHRHPGTVEICYLERGKQTYRVGGKKYHLAGGDVFITAPGEPHDTAGQPEDPGILYWIHLRMPCRGKSLLLLPPRDSAILRQELLHLPERQFPGSVSLKLILDEVFNLYDRRNDPLQRIGMVNLVVRYVLEVLSCSRRQPYSRVSPVLARIMEMIRVHPEENYSLAGLAGQAGLSPSRFKARFKAEAGMAPHEYILRNKTEAARRLLKKRVSVTEVAMELGFSSPQYFATVFRRFSKQTPSDFQRAGPAVPLRRA